MNYLAKNTFEKSSPFSPFIVYSLLPFLTKTDGRDNSLLPSRPMKQSVQTARASCNGVSPSPRSRGPGPGRSPFGIGGRTCGFRVCQISYCSSVRILRIFFSRFSCSFCISSTCAFIRSSGVISSASSPIPGKPPPCGGIPPPMGGRPSPPRRSSSHGRLSVHSSGMTLHQSFHSFLFFLQKELVNLLVLLLREVQHLVHLVGPPLRRLFRIGHLFLLHLLLRRVKAGGGICAHRSTQQSQSTSYPHHFLHLTHNFNEN